MKLYHYTKFSRFPNIWKERKLFFSEWTNTNDVFERGKVYRITRESFESEGKCCGVDAFSIFQSKVFEEVMRYKQISFCVDSNNWVGYASSSMWGYYAREKNGEDIQSGVCIEIDSSKLKKSEYVYDGLVSYTEVLQPTHLNWREGDESHVAHEFVVENMDKLFFVKHKCWEHENEYRFISKNEEFLDISNSIVSVYVLGKDNRTLNEVKRLIGDDVKINFLTIGGLGQLELVPNNLLEHEKIIEELKYKS